MDTTTQHTITMSSTSNNLANNLPSEIWLEILPLAYDPETLLNLRLTCRRLDNLIKQHEHSLVTDIRRSSFPTAKTRLFPALQLTSYSALNVLYTRFQALDEVHSHWLKVVYNSHELSWMKGRWEAIHRAGLLLLYRLVDVEGRGVHVKHSTVATNGTSGEIAGSKSYCTKISLLESLPATSLACLLFKLIASIHILRVYGPEPINNRYHAAEIGMRSDIELALEELLLLYGPGIFLALLQSTHPRRIWATELLKAEIAGMESRQQPDEQGREKPATVISSLRRCLAERCGCSINETVTKMWEILSGTAFDDVSEGKMVALVNGEEIEKGMRRMGF